MRLNNREYPTFRLPLVTLLAALVALGALFVGAQPVPAQSDWGICVDDYTVGCDDDVDCGGAPGSCLKPTAGGVLIQPADNQCMEDVWAAAGHTQDLNCTANDISLIAVHDLVTVNDDGCLNESDTATISFVAEFVLTAQARYDVGVYIAADGGDALTGSCSVANFPSVPSPPWIDIDGGADTCGDIDDRYQLPDQDDPHIFQHLRPITVSCQDDDGDGFADIVACLTWREPGHNDECTHPLHAFPSGPAKCKCQPLPGIEITAVDLVSFTAAPQDHGILAEWQTGSEIDNMGFNLHRALSSAGARTQLNDSLIPSAQPPGSPFGASYSWLDTEVVAGTTYYYWLEDVDLAGVGTLHGPVTAFIEPASVDDPNQQPPDEPPPPPETPFVPEASTLLLLGSAASGLAGYVGLQIRARRRK